MIMLPKGQYTATKTRQWDYEFFEAQMRLTAWVYQVSPAPIAKQAGLAGSQTEVLETSVAESGTKPKAWFLAQILTDAIQGPMGFPFLEFKWAVEDSEEPMSVASRQKTQVDSGHKTLNEIRKENGDEPYDAQIGDRPYVMTGNGPLYLDDNLEMAEQKKEMAEQGMLAQAGMGGGGTDPLAEEEEEGEEEQDDVEDEDEDPDESGKPNPFKKKPKPPMPPIKKFTETDPNDDPRDHARKALEFAQRMAAREEALQKWQRVALDRTRLQKMHKYYDDPAIPTLLRMAIQRRLDKATTADAVRAAFSPWLKKKLSLNRRGPGIDPAA
jgi:hypothetical protein